MSSGWSLIRRPGIRNDRGTQVGARRSKPRPASRAERTRAAEVVIVETPTNGGKDGCSLRADGPQAVSLCSAGAVKSKVLGRVFWEMLRMTVRPLRVLLAASEAVGFAKTGG